jgi:signal transduction histidine kinase
MEAYYLACTGRVDEAIAYAKRELGDDGAEAIPLIYERAGRWKEAYESFKKESLISDSIDNVVLTNSMQGIQDQLALYEAEKQAANDRTYALLGAIFLLTLLLCLSIYIVRSRKKHLQELTKAYNKALESDKMKTAFIQNVSHEVRTPLNIITGFAQVISDPQLDANPEERSHIALMMQRSTRQVTMLIDEVLGLSLIDSTKQWAKDDLCRVNDQLRTLLEEYRNLTEDGVTLQLDTTLPDDLTLRTNANMLRRLVSCLLDNAVKYTTAGHITLRARQTDSTLELQVEDTGCGIPANQAEHIFERFVKLDDFKEGLGLGLSLCRKLAEQLGGQTKLDTTYTDGARFIVTLPLT